MLTKMRNSTSNSELKRDIDDICVLITEDPSLIETTRDFKNNTLKGIQESSDLNSTESNFVMPISPDFSQTRKGSSNLSVTQGNINNLDLNQFTSSYSFNQVCRKFFVCFHEVDGKYPVTWCNIY